MDDELFGRGVGAGDRLGPGGDVIRDPHLSASAIAPKSDGRQRYVSTPDRIGAVEARGEGQISTDDYERLGSATVQSYVTAHDPGANVSDYLLSGGVIVRVKSTSLRDWDYADAVYV